MPFVPAFLPAGAFRTLAPAWVLKVPSALLEKKVLEDLPFAARFYRSVAQLLVQRLAYFSQGCGYSLALLKQLQLKEASTLFAALEDSDLDWLIAVGQVHEYQTGEPITLSRQPLEALHIVLEGGVGLTAPEQAIPEVHGAFCRSTDLPREIEFARLSRGELLGDSLFVDPLPPAYGARALRPSRLLSIPRWRLETKLVYDLRFAAQLYRVLAIVLANKQHNLIGQMGFQVPMQELDESLLHQVNLAESRFEWLLQQLHSRSTAVRPLAAIA